MTLAAVQNFENDLCCVFCNQNVTDIISYGPVYKYKKIIAHYFCLLLSSNIRQNGKDSEGILGFLPEDIQKEVVRGRRLSCSYCRKKGASIGCAVKSCRITFHLPCGLSKQALSLFYDKFPSYCYKHRSWISFPNSENVQVENLTCLICLEKLSLPMGNITWSTCCKNAWYHKRCIQEVALNSGYYFRCPNCNNDQSFRKQMLEFGIYIPNQDASWEREPNAYSAFYERYNHCDAITCYCPLGRDTCRREGSWQIILCYRCLQRGIHKRCGGDLIKRNLWNCSSPECLSETPTVRVTSAETSSGITSQSSTMSPSSSENKENLIPSFNSHTPSSQNFLRRRAAIEVLNASLINEYRRAPLSLRLRSHRERFSDRQTRSNCSFAFNLLPVNSERRQSLSQVLRNRRNLRFKVDTMNNEKKKMNKNNVQRTKQCNRPKKNIQSYSTSAKYYNTRSQPVGKYFDFLGKRRRKYIIDRRVVSVYPFIMKSIKDFEINL